MKQNSFEHIYEKLQKSTTSHFIFINIINQQFLIYFNFFLMK